jgi:hypothetical protein
VAQLVGWNPAVSITVTASGKAVSAAFLLAPGPVHRHDLDLAAEGLGAGLEPALRRRCRAARHHVQQPSRSLACEYGSQVGDHGDEPVGLGRARGVLRDAVERATGVVNIRARRLFE